MKRLENLLRALTFLFLLTGFILAPQSCFASEITEPDESPAAPFHQSLVLRPEQQAQIQDIIRKANAHVKQEKDETHISKIPLPLTKIHAKNKAEKMQNDIAGIRKQALSDIRAKLDASQQPAFDAFCNKSKTDAAAQSQFLQSLNLGRKQKMELAQSAEATKTQTWEIWGDATLSAQQRAAKLQEVQTNATSNIRKQLDEKQLASFDAWLFQQQQLKNQAKTAAPQTKTL